MFKEIDSGFDTPYPNEEGKEEVPENFDGITNNGEKKTPETEQNVPTKEKPFERSQLGEPDGDAIRKIVKVLREGVDVEKINERPAEENDD